jgi:hypothetical protein
MKEFSKLLLIFLIGSFAYIMLCVFNYSPEKVRENGVSHTGEVVKVYKSDTAIVDGKRRSTNNIVVLLGSGDERTLLVNSIEFFAVGEEIPIWEYEGGWFVDKHGNMERPSPFIAIIVFVISLVLFVYVKFFAKKIGKNRGHVPNS